VINIISLISMFGVCIGTMALIIVLSVFNGFENLVTSLYNDFYSDLVIEPATGKTLNVNEIDIAEIKNIEGVANFVEVIEENVLLRQGDKQHIANLKGVSGDFLKRSKVDSAIIEGGFFLQKNQLEFAMIGVGVAYYLNSRIGDFPDPISVYAPRNTGSYRLNMTEDFNQLNIQPSAVFSFQQDIDSKYMIVSLNFAKKILEYSDERTALELNLDEDASLEKVQLKVQSIIGENYRVQNRFEKQASLYKIMKSEKLAIFVILSFILVIATFNIIGSLSMLILDKKKDIVVLQSMGASSALIKRIFLIEGSMISIGGAFLGLILGALICIIQQVFGIIKLGSGDGSFVVDAYPVLMQWTDFILIFITVTIIGLLAAWIPVRKLSARYLNVKLN